MRKLIGLSLALLLAVIAASAQAQIGTDILPATRVYDWTYSGVPSGVPDRTTICATYSSGVSASTLNTALDACDNGVVKLNPGTYNIEGIHVYNDNVTLRGSGADQTIMNGCDVFRLGSGYNTSNGATITSGGAKGSTSFVVSSASGLSVGETIELARDDDSFVVSTIGGSQHIRQVNVITDIAGTTITVRNPLIWDFDAAGNAEIIYDYPLTTNSSGIEDLSVNHTGTSGCTNWNVNYCEGCWIRGVESYNPAGYHFIILGTVNFEFRDSFVHIAQTFGNNNAGLSVYGNPAYGANSNMKIENNIFNKLAPAVELQNSSSGVAVLYNYSYGSAATASDQDVTWTYMDNHGPHDMMNLFEGNIGEMYGSDGYFGGSSHGTAFRNYFDGVNHNSGNTDDPIRLHRLSYNYNLVGNVLGSSTEDPIKYIQSADNCAGGPAIYRLGYPNIGNCSLTDVTGNPVPGGMTYPDAEVGDTLLLWGNYDYYNDATRWESSEIPAGVSTPTTQTLPNSAVYTTTPSWWVNGVAWPPIGPDVTGGNADTAGHANKNPAQVCFEDNSLLGTTGQFNADDCYPGYTLASFERHEQGRSPW